MFTPSQLRAFRAARDAVLAVKPLQEYAPKLLAVAPEFQEKFDELAAVTDYVERFAAVALAAVGE